MFRRIRNRIIDRIAAEIAERAIGRFDLHLQQVAEEKARIAEKWHRDWSDLKQRQYLETLMRATRAEHALAERSKA